MEPRLIVAENRLHTLADRVQVHASMEPRLIVAENVQPTIEDAQGFRLQWSRD